MKAPSAPAATAFDHDSTLVLAVELSGKGWEVGAVLPGVTRRPRRSLAPRDMTGLLRQIERWKAEAERTGRTVRRTVLAYEVGRDGFWIARYLLAHGIAVQIMHPASIPVERRGRRAKTDRIDLDMLLRTLLAWLRGEPRVLDGARPERSRRGHEASGAGTRAAGQRADRVGEPHRGSIVPARDHRLQAASQEGGGTAGRTPQHRRRTAAADAAGGVEAADGTSLRAE